jgi:leucyl-tRNA synthetase
MAVPAHDSRDYAFAKHFNLPIIPLIEGADVSEESYDAKEGIMCNSASDKFSLNGLTVKEAIAATKKFVTEQGLGRVKVNYRLRDAIFSRQRYWGEPFPVYYKDDMPYMIPKECLPLELPEIDEYKPTETGEPPLGRAKKWAWDTKFDRVVDCSEIDNKSVFPLELNTMPGFAGSSAYYLRYMDPKNDRALVSKDADEYWQNVDLYVGGTEHATGHLIYSRFWNKFLYDSGYSCTDEPFKKLVNQGMIQGWSSFVFRIKGTNQYVSFDLIETRYDNDAKKNRYFYGNTEVDPIYTDISTVNGKELDIDKIREWMPEFKDAEFIVNPEGKYIVNQVIEKMSKSKYNVVNPDDICNKYGADTLRLYEMFLGPIEQSKPWDVAGIDGCHRFLKKFWNLVTAPRNNDVPSKEMMKSVHKLIKKVSQDIEIFSYNTSISAFMICVNELSQLKCHNTQLFRQMVILIAPFAPHIAEELWHILGGEGSVCDAQWPEWDEQYLVEDSVRLGVAFNGKTRFDMEFPADADNNTIEQAVLAEERARKYIEDKQIVKVIIVPKRMVNIVLK